MIARGRLGSGERLPSVRGLAEAAGVNVNTARSVYGQLESEGLIASRQGLGTFVTERPAAAAELQRIATTAVAEAREAGLDPGVLAPAVYAEGAIEPASATEPPASVSSTHLPDVATESDQRGVRRELRRQIERLEAELAKHKLALDIAGKAHALLEMLAESAAPEQKPKP
jgi:DNA-binding transcriptional MocR family regulator